MCCQSTCRTWTRPEGKRKGLTNLRDSETERRRSILIAALQSSYGPCIGC